MYNMQDRFHMRVYKIFSRKNIAKYLTIDPKLFTSSLYCYVTSQSYILRLPLDN